MNMNSNRNRNTIEAKPRKPKPKGRKSKRQHRAVRARALARGCIVAGWCATGDMKYVRCAVLRVAIKNVGCRI